MMILTSLFLTLLLSSRSFVLTQDSNCLESQWLEDGSVYNPGIDCEPNDGSKVPNCTAFIFQGTNQPYYHLHEYDCSKFWECGPAGETCLFHCAPCGDLCPGYNGLSFDCRYQYPMGPVCDFPINVDCTNHIPCPDCDSCPFDWQTCDDGTGCKCAPECQEDPHCPNDQYCDSVGVCQDGCRSAEGCLATVCSECVNHQCVDPNCCSDKDCPNGVCLDDECMTCIVDDDCNTNGGCSTCVGSQCVTPDCCVDDDCLNGVCLDGSCVECVVDEDCNEDGGCSSCLNNQCLAPQCCTDDDCNTNGGCSTCVGSQCVTPYCCVDDDCLNGVCLDGSCVECVVDDDCNEDGGCSSCLSNQCLAPQCCTDDDCEVGQHCNDGFCEGECNMSDHCPNGDIDALCDVPIYNDCQYCNTDSHLCDQGCDDDSNCPSDYPVCNSGHTCGCSDTSDCLGSGAICNTDSYNNCAYCDSTNAQCKPGCDTDSNCPTDFPICQADHTCGCTADSDCEDSNGICDVDSSPYNYCQFCDLTVSQCKPGCIHDFNCPPTYLCGEDHLCVLDGECDSQRPCADDGDLCDSDYSNCFYCDISSKTCEPGCEESSECVGFGSSDICNSDHRCQAVGISGVISITVNTYSCDGCPGSGGFATEEGGIQITLKSGSSSCSTNGLDNIELTDYDNGIIAFFDADRLQSSGGVDDDGLGQCRGADLNLRLTGGKVKWTGTGTWTGSDEIPICINFFGENKPTCCCELDNRSLAQGGSSDLEDCSCFIPSL